MSAVLLLTETTVLFFLESSVTLSRDFATTKFVSTGENVEIKHFLVNARSEKRLYLSTSTDRQDSPLTVVCNIQDLTLLLLTSEV